MIIFPGYIPICGILGCRVYANSVSLNIARLLPSEWMYLFTLSLEVHKSLISPHEVLPTFLMCAMVGCREYTVWSLHLSEAWWICTSLKLGHCTSFFVTYLFIFFVLFFVFPLDFLFIFSLINRISLTILDLNPWQAVKLGLSSPSLRIYHLSRGSKDQPGSGSPRVDICCLTSSLTLPLLSSLLLRFEDSWAFKILRFVRSFLTASLGKLETSGRLRAGEGGYWECGHGAGEPPAPWPSLAVCCVTKTFIRSGSDKLVRSSYTQPWFIWIKSKISHCSEEIINLLEFSQP